MVRRAGKLLIFFLVITWHSFAQPKASVQHYATDDGLSHVGVTNMIKDRQGFMWFATWDGINRFDGSRFVSYKSFPGDHSPLKSDRVDDIVEGDNDHLWLKTYDNQIYNFNKATGQLSPLSPVFAAQIRSKLRFDKILAADDHQLWLQSAGYGIFYFPDAYKSPSKYIQFKNGAKAGHNLASNNINFFYFDKDRSAWVGTNKGLTCLHKDADGIYRSDPSRELIKENFTDVAENNSNLFFACASGNLYIRDKKTGITAVKKIADTRLNNLLISKKYDVIYISTASGSLFASEVKGTGLNKIAQAHEEINSLYEDSKGNLWIEPGSTGVMRYDIAAHTLKTYHQETDINSKFSGNHFRVFQDVNGFVWVSLKKGGFGYYDNAKDNIAYFYDDPRDVNKKFSNNIFNLFYDPAGILWLTTDERGIEKIVFQAYDFQQYQPSTPGMYKSDNDVRGLAVDGKGRIWAGTKSNKLYVIDNGRQLGNIFVNMPKEGLGQVYCITPDTGGIIWMGTKSNGLYKAQPVDKSETAYNLTHFQADVKDPNSISSNQIYTILADKHGRIWTGSFDGGVNLMVENGRSARFIHQQELIRGLPAGQFNKIRRMELDGAGNVWVATTDGLLVIQTQVDQIPYTAKIFTKIPGDATSLGNNDIQFIYRDKKNTMWLGTSGGGLSEAVGGTSLKDMKFRNYTSHDGLFNDYIVSIAGDKTGCLWLASQNGLTRFNPRSGRFRNFENSDGIPKTVFSESACAYTLNGGLVFGSMDGLISFKPEQLTDRRILGQIAFTDLKINDQNFNQIYNESEPAHEINGLSSITLKHNQNVISFDYTVLDYRTNERQNYRYRLKGFDTTWYSSRGLQRATYTNLPPGKYTFEIKCVSNGLYNNVPYKSLQIHILPPPWLTWWAYVLYVIAALAIFIAIRKTELTMLRLRDRILVEQKLDTLKTNFFTNISHELRTPLTLIVNPITAIAETEELSAKGKEYITIVQKNANRMVRFINQLLDLRKVQSGKAVLACTDVEMLDFIKDICRYFNDIAREKNISLSVTADAGAITCHIDLEKIDIVIYNILANAYKFSKPDKKITINLYADEANENVTIAIADEGGGVPEDSLQDLFKLFYEGGHHQQKGTGIGLALAKEMVELHGGSIWAFNNEGGGLTVNVRLKMLHRQVIDTVAPAIVKEKNDAVATESITDADMLTEAAGQLVLLVEDNADLRTFLSREIGEQYRVATAENGLEGLNVARKILPDVIVSDIMMPEMDGIQMLDHLKKDETTSHIPVILLSARQSIESQIEGLQYGADNYITKPFNNQFLMASINNILARRKKFFENMVDKVPMDFNPSDIVITSQDEEFLQRVIRIVEEGMTDPDFNIDDAVNLMNMSRSPFYKKLKSLTNLAPVEFIREMRLKRAKQYMDAGETFISDIAYKSGFHNVKYFSTCFKDHFKKSPSEYLKEIGSKHSV